MGPWPAGPVRPSEEALLTTKYKKGRRKKFGQTTQAMVFEPYGGGSLDQNRAGRKPVVKHASKLAVGSAGTQVKSRFGASF